MSNNQDNNYRDSLKATSLFGGLGFYKILIRFIRGKFIAILLGPEGVGIMGLLSSSKDIIGNFSQLGLSTSAVRNIAEANAAADRTRIAIVIGVLRRLIWVTGIIGLAICFLLAPELSRIAFKSGEYSNAFRMLSSTILLDQLSQGQSALLQGMRHYNYLVRASAVGMTLGLIFSIPMFYLWGIEAIVPVMIISSITSLVFTFYFSQKIKTSKIRITVEDLKSEGFNMISMGFLITIKSILVTISSYIVRIFISRFGTIKDVGLYGAGFSLVNMSVNVIFDAMGADYYPRLSSLASNKDDFNKAINQQAEITLLLITPIVVSVIIFVIPIIILFYSKKFVQVENMIYWAMFATIFKGYSWAIAFSFIARGDRNEFFWNETIAAAYMFGFNITFYYFWGLTGMGISFLVSYVIYSIQVWIICSKKYEVSISKIVLKILLIQTLLGGCSLGTVIITDSYIRYILGIMLVSITFFYSYIELNKRINIIQVIKSRISILTKKGQSKS